jgi:hypothetical protein
MRRMLFTALTLALTCVSVSDPRAQPQASVSVFASGLNDPRGVTFGPDSFLYVAEAGAGGATLSTVGLCAQVQPPVGPWAGGFTGRIVRFTPDGGFGVVVAGLPSSEASPAIGGDKLGVADVEFIGNHLLALIAGAGCSHGHADVNNAVISVDRDSNWSVVADLSRWLLANPGTKGAEVPRNPDYEPDGTWYSLLFDQGRLYALEPNHGLLVQIRPPDGHVELVRDLFATFGDNTYTVMAFDRGSLYIGTLGRIAFLPGVFPPVPDLEHSFDAAIYRLRRDGTAEVYATGLKAILGLAFDAQHRLYAIQSPIFVPGTGSLVRVEPSGEHELIVGGLTFPSALEYGPDRAFYVPVCGYHCLPGQGQILRVTLGR